MNQVCCGGHEFRTGGLGPARGVGPDDGVYVDCVVLALGHVYSFIKLWCYINTDLHKSA